MRTESRWSDLAGAIPQTSGPLKLLEEKLNENDFSSITSDAPYFKYLVLSAVKNKAVRLSNFLIVNHIQKIPDSLIKSILDECFLTKNLYLAKTIWKLLPSDNPLKQQTFFIKYFKSIENVSSDEKVPQKKKRMNPINISPLVKELPNLSIKNMVKMLQIWFVQR